MVVKDVTRLLTPQDDEWDEWITRAPHDFYHLAAYHQLAGRSGEGQPYLAVYGSPDQFLAWPYLRRSIDGTYYDATSVYGYATPTGLGLDEGDFMQRAWRALRLEWREQRLVSMFTRLHPLIENHALIAQCRGEMPPDGQEVVCPGRSVSISVDAKAEDRRRAYSQSTRRQLKLAIKRGATTNIDPDWLRVDEFMEIYQETMDRNRASQRYYFSRDYFEAFRGALSGKAYLGFADHDGRAAAAMLFTICGPIAQMHLVGMRQQFRDIFPNKLLIDRVADFVRDHRVMHFHLGAGRGGYEDSLFEFKSRFSKATHDFCIGRWVLDREVYMQLSKGMECVDGFFPAYRAIQTEVISAAQTA